jgi:hypothetical protein
VVVSIRGGGVATSITLTAVQGTGGHYEAIAAASALPGRLRELAARLSGEYERAKRQYKVEYISGVTDVAEARIALTIARPGISATMGRRPAAN